jgi:hypothetical protein
MSIRDIAMLATAIVFIASMVFIAWAIWFSDS